MTDKCPWCGNPINLSKDESKEKKKGKKQPKGKMEQLREKVTEIRDELAKSIKETQDSIENIGIGEFSINTETDL